MVNNYWIVDRDANGRQKSVSLTFVRLTPDLYFQSAHHPEAIPPKKHVIAPSSARTIGKDPIGL